MRALLVIALSIVGLLAGSAAATASNLSRFYAAHYDPSGRRATPLLIYQYEPGVVVRAYWLPPWRHRHFFPRTGRRPAIGRKEHFSTGSLRPRPAQSFERVWSNAWAFERAPAPVYRERAPLSQRRYAPLPEAPKQ